MLYGSIGVYPNINIKYEANTQALPSFVREKRKWNTLQGKRLALYLLRVPE